MLSNFNNDAIELILQTRKALDPVYTSLFCCGMFQPAIKCNKTYPWHTLIFLYYNELLVICVLENVWWSLNIYITALKYTIANIS